MNKEIKTDNGGAAFPVAGLSGLPNDNFIHPQEGMTLRDYFAAAAMTGSVGYVNEFAPAYAASLKHTSQAAYRIADAMLAARKENQS
jgi:hypothetical protein